LIPHFLDAIIAHVLAVKRFQEIHTAWCAHYVVCTLVDQLRGLGRPLRSARGDDLVLANGPWLQDEELSQALDPSEFVRRGQELGGPEKEGVQRGICFAQEELKARRRESLTWRPALRGLTGH
jgi:hypothetical protein